MKNSSNPTPEFKQIVLDCYVYFYKTVKNYSSYSYPITQKIDVELSNFYKLLEKKVGVHSIGINWMIDYFCFQFNYWEKLNTTSMEGHIPLSWIIGPKAFIRWESKNEHYQYFYQTELLKEFNFDFTPLFLKFKQPETNNFQELFDVERSRFFNTERGLVHCKDFTDLYSPRSLYCLTCENSTDCKKIKHAISNPIKKVTRKV